MHITYKQKIKHSCQHRFIIGNLRAIKALPQSGRRSSLISRINLLKGGGICLNEKGQREQTHHPTEELLWVLFQTACNFMTLILKVWRFLTPMRTIEKPRDSQSKKKHLKRAHPEVAIRLRNFWHEINCFACGRLQWHFFKYPAVFKGTEQFGNF